MIDGGYRPGLDGLRGVALASVLLFHAELGDHGSLLEWAHMPGAWGGVSTFFTLSGFLICSLLLREHDEDGRISMRAFYARRARRLLPALLLALGGVVLFGATVADASQLRNLRGDVLASLGYVANWRFGLGETSYADLFASPSPLLHFWTVAIEEQFYLLFPPALTWWLARRAGRDPLPGLLGALGVALAVLVASGLAGADEDLVYFGTHTRAGELLAGAALAAAVHTGRHTRLLGHLRWAGPAAMAAMVLIWATVDQGTDLLYHGGFTAYAGLSVLAVLAAATPGNPLETLLRREPLRTLGEISYGVYLFHWPIYLWLTPERTDLDDLPLLLVRLALSIGAGWLSYHLVEHPIRRGRLLHGAQTPIALAATLVLVLTTAFAATTDPPADPFDQQLAALEGTDPGSGEHAIAFLGDSTVIALASGTRVWAADDDRFRALHPVSAFGCGVTGIEVRRRFGDENRSEECATVVDDAVASAAAEHPLAVVVSTSSEVLDHRLPDGRWASLGDPELDELVLTSMLDAVDRLEALDVTVLWVRPPDVRYGDGGGPPLPEDDPARMARYRALVDELGRRRPSVEVVDLATHLDDRPGGPFDPVLRPDGVHLSLEGGLEVATDLLAPAYERALDLAG